MELQDRSQEYKSRFAPGDALRLHFNSGWKDQLRYVRTVIDGSTGIVAAGHAGRRLIGVARV